MLVLSLDCSLQARMGSHFHVVQRARMGLLSLIIWALMIACIGLVLGFCTSSNLAAAYGIAVGT